MSIRTLKVTVSTETVLRLAAVRPTHQQLDIPPLFSIVSSGVRHLSQMLGLRWTTVGILGSPGTVAYDVRWMMGVP